jgi:hypothetical protein
MGEAQQKIRVRQDLAQRFERADLRLLPPLHPVIIHYLLFLTIFPMPARPHKNHQTNEKQQLGRIPRFFKILKYRRMVI